MIVVDASTLLELLLNASGAARVARRLASAGESLHAPHVVDAEVAQVLRRWSLSAEIAELRAAEAMADFLAIPLTRWAHPPLLNRVWQLRRSISAFDALYVALAEALDVPLLTRDARLARSHGHRARIELA